MKRAFVTGATGCLGRNLVNVLSSDGWHITALHRASSDLSRLRGCNVDLRVVDLHDLDSTCAALDENIDAVFHVAGNTSHWARDEEAQWKDNVLATRNLVQASLKKNVGKFIFTSTGATLSHQGSDEKLSSRIVNNYTRTKRLAELEVEKGSEQGLYSVRLQPIIVFGAYDYHSYTEIFRGIKSGKLKSALPGRIAFCHAEDVANAHLQAFNKGRCRESYVLGGTYTTWLDVYQRIARLLDAPPPQTTFSPLVLRVLSEIIEPLSHITGKKPFLTPDLVRLLGDAPDVSFCEKRKAAEELGYQSRPLDNMLEDCYRWLVEEGGLTFYPRELAVAG